MNFRKLFTFAMTTTLAAGAVLSTSAQQPRRSRPGAQGTVVQQLPPDKIKVLPDIEVKIEASENASMTPLLNNGSSLPVQGAKIYVRFTIKNTGAVKAENFTYKMVIERDGLKVYDPAAAKLTLNANETKTFPPVEVSLPGHTNVVDARILADIGNLVQEKNEQNNKATFKFTGQVLH
ncbi:MAG TPA: CARDB domain-containing protein [Blastocatellia bacterium]|nr:CARDB domain-containing protein [Blastocatellia bacterium]